VKKKSKKYYVYLKKNALVHLGLSIEEINGILMNFKVVVDDRKIR
jgi:hypothetical protein